ncbi:MAG: RNase adapter RapZ [Eubacteriales bacterium]
MRFVVVTGMSGAGKSSVLKMLEDAGYYCIDNLLVTLMPKLVDLLREPQSEIDKIALGIDIRSGKNFGEVDNMLSEWRAAGLEFEVLFMDSNDKVLIKRYKETRRSHPFSTEERVEYSIAKERKCLENIKKSSTYIIDTSQLLTRELKKEITRIFVNDEEYKNLYITILSFGFKNGIPVDADLVFDVRFLPNPYYIEELKKISGNEKAVRDYVMQNEKSQVFLAKLHDMIEFLIPNYILEGKNHLVVAIGCTGGKHRSVTIANELYEILNGTKTYGIRVEHRDIQRENIIKEI